MHNLKRQSPSFIDFINQIALNFPEHPLLNLLQGPMASYVSLRSGAHFRPRSAVVIHVISFLLKNVQTFRAEIVFYSFLSIRWPYTVLVTKKHLVTIERMSQ